ncbi:hypothetical protein SUDANB181_01236 [Streptomyces sp. enrichment culture]
MVMHDLYGLTTCSRGLSPSAAMCIGHPVRAVLGRTR